jgi:NCAIR mutase (PurE)-related protein
VEGEPQKELEATIAARKELGPEHEEHLIAGFLERIDKEIDRRVEERVARRHRPQLALNKESVGIAVPVVAVAGIFGGVVGVVGALIALAVIFVAVSVSRR